MACELCERRKDRLVTYYCLGQPHELDPKEIGMVNGYPVRICYKGKHHPPHTHVGLCVNCGGKK